MKRHLAAFTIALMLGTTAAAVLALPVLTGDTAWARAGRGMSGGGRGSRTFSAPAQPGSPTSPSRPMAPATSPASPMPQRSGWGAGLLGGLGGLVLGGLIGSMLFGGLGHGFGGGFGLLEIALLGVLAYFAFSFFRRRQAAPATAGGYGASSPASSQVERPTWQPSSAAASVATAEPAAGPGDLDVGLRHIRSMDAGFDPGRVAAAATDVFFKVQAAWMARDMGVARDVLHPEMYERMQAQCAELRAQRRINRLENIAVRSTEVTEAWQETGHDFVTVAIRASVLDYTTDESGQLVEGSRTEPVQFEEYWTFVRPVGPNPWKLTAIQQPSGV
jgi:predicted lipid-binding transport protein (Tim44 family)